ncbi:MAG: circularly permuted type 2 ATP-grasp protein [Gammaproteobacteria bacterium]|nr:circularly permuted type 2 ATP-grasp protein [Gammaproteobacteria bacterium]
MNTESNNPERETSIAGLYQTAGSAYDEFMGDGKLRRHWGFIGETLLRKGTTWAANLDASVGRLLKENAVTYLADGTRRPWQLDGLPFVLDPDEWQTLETGLIQRARLLNKIVADLYGPQDLLMGDLPPALAFANPDYLLPSCGYEAPEGVYLHLLAFDLGRSPDGQWRVLSNRTEAPSGLGFALENRMIMARCLPELFERSGISRLAYFFRSYSDNLQRLGALSTAGDGLAVILSGGPEDAIYSEHTFLGRYLGFPVVEGADLTVRDGRLYLKTLEGLKMINLVTRQIESADCDPLELRPQSMMGVPGLLRAASNKNVVIGNAIGSGVVENDAIMSFLPALCLSLLEEELALPSLATWWCGQPEEQAYVQHRIDALVLRQAFVRRPLLESSVLTYMATDVDEVGSAQLEQAINLTPYHYVGREPVALSTVPYWNEQGHWEAAPMMLRLYVAATENGYQVMPGGLARVSTPSGDISKDVWVRANESFLTNSPANLSVATRRSDRDLPSRTADDLFWLGRYLERSEGAVRLYRTLFRYIGGGGDADEQPVALDILTRLLGSMDYLSSQRARRAAVAGQQAVEQELWNILFGPESKDGLARVLANVYRTANHVRERLSRDAWRLFEALSEVPQLRWRVHSVADASRLLNDLIEKLSAVNGQIHENMTRGHGWRLLDLGRRLERSRFVVQVIGDLCTNEPQQPGALNLLLDACDSSITHRARYRANPTLNTVLDLLLVDNSNPRAVIHQVEIMQEHMSVMPMEHEEKGLSESGRILLTAHTDLALADVDKLVDVISKRGRRTHLARLLKRTEQAVDLLSQEITRTYFDHTSRHS